MSLRKIQEEDEYSVEINKNEVTKLKEAFEELDKKKIGKILANQIHDVLQTTIKDNQDFYADDIEEALDEMGKSIHEKVSLNELLEVVKRLRNPKSIIEAFKWFDKDKNGFIKIDELRSILQMVNGTFTEEEINEIFIQSDANKDGKIDYKEFVQYWHNQ